MASLKCKMCGGELQIRQGETVAVCEYCGSKQTLPKTMEETLQNLFNRANNLRLKCEFDKAEQIYEKIVQQDDSEAEAHWGLVLCKFGIEYVEDPKTKKRIPTCHRTLYEAITADPDYQAAIDYSDASQQSIYENEAQAINEIQKGILAISEKEDPFDVFICYKETDQNGRRTVDSVLANDLYHQLVQEGFKVFFSRITLEDKLGTAYEPYIFAALNSAKVMVVLGTKPEHFSAVWVKNEWSRYLALVKQSNGKKILIPAYRDMDPYDLPEEFSHLQAQDMSKLGFMQDLIRGIKKIAEKDNTVTLAKDVAAANENTNVNVAPLLKRMFLFLEDGEWERADEFSEKVLNIDPENAEAYLGKLMVDLHVHNQDDLMSLELSFESNNNYLKAKRFSNEKLALQLDKYLKTIEENKRNAQLEEMFSRAVDSLNRATCEKEYISAAKLFENVSGYKNSDELKKVCYEKAESYRKNTIYMSAIKQMTFDAENQYNAALGLFEMIPGWKDVDERISICRKRLEEIRIQKETNERIAKERCIAKEIAVKRRKKIATIVIIVFLVLVSGALLLVNVVVPEIERSTKYNMAMSLYNAGKYEEAYLQLRELSGYRDADSKTKEFLKRYLDVKMKTAKVGDTVSFGFYEQDNNLSNGKESIEWFLIAKEDNRILLLSKHVLDSQAYNNYGSYITWEDSTLREWLNGTFFENAFSSSEQLVVQSSIVAAGINPQHNISAGNNTTDKVFLLSISEVERLFVDSKMLQCEETAYADNDSNDQENCRWWLRSPGYSGSYVSYVKCDGSISYIGWLSVLINGVRPALWIDLSS